MNDEENRREKDEREFDRLRDAGEGGRKRHREVEPADGLAPFGSGGAVHGQTGGRHSEHHDREESGHERARGGVPGKETAQVSLGAFVVADHEPRDVVQDVMQPGDDQQAIEQTVNEKPDLARPHDGAAG